MVQNLKDDWAATNRDNMCCMMRNAPIGWKRQALFLINPTDNRDTWKYLGMNVILHHLLSVVKLGGLAKLCLPLLCSSSFPRAISSERGVGHYLIDCRHGLQLWIKIRLQYTASLNKYWVGITIYVAILERNNVQTCSMHKISVVRIAFPCHPPEIIIGHWQGCSQSAWYWAKTLFPTSHHRALHNAKHVPKDFICTFERCQTTPKNLGGKICTFISHRQSYFLSFLIWKSTCWKAGYNKWYHCSLQMRHHMRLLFGDILYQGC